MELICEDCLEEFLYNRSKGHTIKPPVCGGCRTRRRREDIRQRILEYIDYTCVVCGYNRCQRALTFHHREPQEKSFNISRNYWSKSWDTIKLEIDKCDVLCFNCHMELECDCNRDCNLP